MIILCLSLGISSVLFMAYWIRNELSYDQFNTKSENIYRLTIENHNEEMGYYNHLARTVYPSLNNIKDDMPQVIDLVRFSHLRDGGIIQKMDGTVFKSDVFYTDPSVFNIFSFEFLHGSTSSLNDPYCLVLTESSSMKYFGVANSIGQKLTIYCRRCKERKVYTVTGILNDIPSTSHIHFDALASYEDPKNFNDWAYYYILIGPNSNPAEVLSGFNSFAMKYVPEMYLKNFSPHLMRLTDIHLQSHLDREHEQNGNYQDLILFGSLSLFAFVVALINFMNLISINTLRSNRLFTLMRVNGATSRNITLFHATEALSFIISAIIVSLFFFLTLLGRFNTLMDASINLQIKSDIFFLVFLILILFIVSLVFGLSPLVFQKKKRALYNIRVINVFGLGDPNLGTKQQFGVSKVLICMQYVATLIIVISLIIISQQLSYFIKGSLINKNEKILCILNMPLRVHDKYQVFKSQLLSNPIIIDVTASLSPPGKENVDMKNIEASDVSSGIQEKLVYVYPVDNNYFTFYNKGIISGSDFPSFPGDELINENYIINERAVRYLEWDPQEVIGRNFRIIAGSGGNLFKGGKIIGVVEDFQMSSMSGNIKPYVFFQKSMWLFCAQVKFEITDISQAVEFINKTWQEIFPEYPIEYQYVQDLYKTIYNNEFRLKNISRILTFLAIILSSIGLIGITGLLYQQKIKEIGIRKTNGASSREIFLWLLKDIIKILVIAISIAIPVTWFLMQYWISNYANRIELKSWYFISGSLIVFVFALLSVSIQAIRASKMNPVESLRYE